MTLLTIERVSMRFGGLVAIDNVSFDIRAGDITAVIGPNGAGKTTLFNCITGFYKPTAGRMTLRAEDGNEFLLEQIPGYRIAKEARVARTFQNIRLFAGMSVLENLMVAQHNKLMKASAYSFAGLFGLPGFRRAEREAVDKAKFWLDKLG
ncbi:MAG TPA: ATP-binding cassette domain-containing protein, partial [Inquilinus sp.]|nr:ATP-binding cassette domain-containing protein [Inquilinus sp.]